MTDELKKALEDKDMKALTEEELEEVSGGRWGIPIDIEGSAPSLPADTIPEANGGAKGGAIYNATRQPAAECVRQA